MSKIMYGLYLPLVFPEGLAPGSGSDFNTLILARDGKGKPVLRGTALAGALRHACGEEGETFFGSSCGKDLDEGVPSLLKVPDISLSFDPTRCSEEIRTHHMRNRHTNTVLDGALFSLESCPPGTLAEVLLWLEGSSENKKRDETFLAHLAGFFIPERGGFLVGGNAARGIGRAIFQPDENARFKAFEFRNEASLGEYLDFRQNANDHFSQKVKAWKKVSIPENKTSSDRLTVQFELKIPRGQDILIADGDMAPQRVRNREGKLCWRIPGSTLRGLFRSWITRLAAREGKDVMDTHAKYREFIQSGTPYDGDSLAWLFVRKLERKNKKEELRRDMPAKYPVQYLFGTGLQRGRIHFSDALVPISSEPEPGNFSKEENFRSHVRIDPITGGAVPGALFSNTTLTSQLDRSFSVTVFVENPQEHEAKWLAQTLQALDFGLLRLGSSKASGRVQLASSPTAYCPSNMELEKIFTEIEPYKEFKNLSDLEIVPKKAAETSPKLNWEPSILYIEGKNFKAKNPQKDTKMPIYADALWDTGKENFKDGDEISILRAGGKIKRICPRGKESDEVLDAPPQKPSDVGKFYNPYTFISFDRSTKKINAPSLLTVDEEDKTRFSGVIEMELRNLRPLLSVSPIARHDETSKVAKFPALSIGNDVIVPATAIRGHIRNLMTIFTSGQLNNLDPNLWVYQQKRTTSTTDERFLFLGKVIVPGNAFRSGIVQVASKMLLVSRKELEDKCPELKNGKHDSICYVKPLNPKESNPEKRKVKRTTSDDPQAWQVRLSGTPVPGKRKDDGSPAVKKDAIVYFAPEERKLLELAPEKWVRFESINSNGVHQNLAKGDIVWLEITDEFKGKIENKIAVSPECDSDIQNIQWTRWGKDGRKLLDMIPKENYPAHLCDDDQVDLATDLFGQTSNNPNKKYPMFSGRIRPENLVFADASLEHDVELAPLMAPHPGCAGFYHQDGKFRGFKVYRNDMENENPWLYSEQGIYGDDGRPKPFDGEFHRVRKADLLKIGQTGRLRISFRALSPLELQLLIMTCQTAWRLGGGKPLGLGLCKTVKLGVQIWNDDASVQTATGNLDDSQECKKFENQIDKWEKTQKPVSKVRYPRAVRPTKRNDWAENYQRGGHSWFSVFTHSNPTLDETYCKKRGWKERTIKQELKKFGESGSLKDDCLYGYDVLLRVERNVNGANQYSFDLFEEPEIRDRGEKMHPNDSQNRESRMANKEKRKEY